MISQEQRGTDYYDSQLNEIRSKCNDLQQSLEKSQTQRDIMAVELAQLRRDQKVTSGDTAASEKRVTNDILSRDVLSEATNREEKRK